MRTSEILRVARCRAICALLSLCAFGAGAATLTWSGLGGDGKWGTAKNWAASASEAGAVPQDGDSLVFPASAYQETVNDLRNLVLAQISFTGAGAQRLSGCRFTLSQGSGSSDVAWSSSTGAITNDCAVVLAAGDQKFNLAAQRVMMNGLVSGPGTLVRVGSQNHASALTLTHANTYTGGTRIEKGIVEIRDDYALGATNAEVFCAVASESLGLNAMATLLVDTDNVYNPIRTAAGTTHSGWVGDTFAGCQILSHRANVRFWNRISGGNLCVTFAGPDLVTMNGSQLKIVNAGTSVGPHYFHGPVDVTGLKLYSGAQVHFYGPVTNRLASLAGHSYGSIPAVTFYSSENNFNGTTLSAQKFYVYLGGDHACDGLGNVSLLGQRENALFLQGHDLAISNIVTTANASGADETYQGIHGGNAGHAAVLTVRGDKDNLCYARFTEGVSIVWDPVGDYTLTVSSNRNSTLRGPIVVKRGTVSLEGAHTMKYLDEIDVRANATFALKTTTSLALQRLHFVRVAAGGRFTVDSGSGAAFTASQTEFYLEKGAKLVLASGATLSPRCVVYDGQGVAGDTYETAEWLEGSGSVTVPAVAAVKRLPAYVATSSKGYFNALVRADKTMRVALSYRTDNTDNDKFLFGVRGSGNWFSCYRRASKTTETLYPEMGSGNIGAKYVYMPSLSARHGIDYSIDGLYMNGRLVCAGSDVETYATQMLSDYELKIAGVSYNANMQDYYLPCEIYGLTVWRNGRLVRQFVPAVDENDVACLYDGVSKTLFYKAGGTVTAATADSTEVKIENGEILYCVTVSSADEGRVRVNGGGLSTSTNVWAGITETLVLTAAATNGSPRVFGQWEGLATYSAGGPLASTVTVSPAVPGSLSVVYGIRNRDDPTDTRPHAYMIRTQDDGKGSSLWTDGEWRFQPTWWLEGYIPQNSTDIAHFTDFYGINLYPHWWLDFPNGNWTIETLYTAIKPKLNMSCGWDKAYCIQDQTHVLGRWQHWGSTVGGFGTTDDITPVTVNRAWSRSVFNAITPKADHELTITELSGNGLVRKMGPGRFTFTQPYRGGLKLEAGTVRLGAETPTDGYEPGVYARFDATATNLITLTADPSGTKRITKWVESEGRKNASGSIINLNGPYVGNNRWFYGPTIGSKTVNGIHLIDYGAYTAVTNNGTSLTADSVTKGEREKFGSGGGLNSNCYNGSINRSIFMAYEYPSKTGASTPVSYWDVSGGFSPKASGDGLLEASDQIQFAGRHWINGAPTKSEVFQNHEFHDGHAFAVYSTSATNGYNFWHSGLQPGASRVGGIRAAEMLVYTNTLTDAQCYRNVRYLQKKWHDRKVNDIYPWTLDYLFVTPSDDTANLEVLEGEVASIRTTHRPQWTELAGKALVKTGGGTLELDRVSTNLDIVVKGGAVKFIRETAIIADDPEPAPHPLIWCDATKKSSFIFQEGSESNIVAWCDCRETSAEMLTNWVATARWATLNTNGLHNLPCVDFGTAFDSTGPRLGLASDTNTTSAIGATWKTQIMDGFIVWRNIAPAGKYPVIFHDPCASSMERKSQSLSYGPKFSPWESSGEAAFYLAAYWTVDGRLMHPVGEFFDYGREDYIVIRFRAQGPTYMNQLGGKNKSGNGGGVQVAEFIGYTYPLSDFEARQTEAYLMKKWKDAAHPDTTTALDGINSLTFAGGEAVLDTSTDRTFGTVTGEGTLVKRGAGKATVGSLRGISGVRVEEGSLAVSGDKVTVDSLSVYLSADGTAHGTLVSEGEIELVEGGTLTVDVDAAAARPPIGAWTVVAADPLTGGEDWTVACTHAKAKRVKMVLAKDGDELSLVVMKQGIAFLIR